MKKLLLAGAIFFGAFFGAQQQASAATVYYSWGTCYYSRVTLGYIAVCNTFGSIKWRIKIWCNPTGPGANYTKTSSVRSSGEGVQFQCNVGSQPYNLAFIEI